MYRLLLAGAISLSIVAGAISLSIVAGSAFAQTPSPSPTVTPPPPPPPPEGKPCSPGFWKNHPEEFNDFCEAAAASDLGDRFPDCASLLTALECNGSDRSCGRSAAAALLNAESACVEN